MVVKHLLKQLLETIKRNLKMFVINFFVLSLSALLQKAVSSPVRGRIMDRILAMQKTV